MRAVDPAPAATPPGANAARPSRQAGFTVVELAVATAILLLAVLLACDLLDESARLLAHSARRAQDSSTLLAGELLRNDIRGSVAAPGSDGLWQHEPLVLVVPGPGAVLWSFRDGVLYRASGDLERALLRPVEAFRWRDAGPGVVEVEVTLGRSGAWAGSLAGSLPRGDRRAAERLHVVVASGPGRAGW